MKMFTRDGIINYGTQPIFNDKETSTAKAFNSVYRKLSIDPVLEERSRRVADLAINTAELLRLPDKILISLAAYMTDLGMTTWPPELITKFPLEALDWGLIKAHTYASVNVASEIWRDMPPLVRAIVRGHHERPGGTGYPDNIFDPSIEILLVAACDVFDAMTSKRPYRIFKTMPIREAFLEISKFAPAGLVAALAGAYIENKVA